MTDTQAHEQCLQAAVDCLRALAQAPPAHRAQLAPALEQFAAALAGVGAQPLQGAGGFAQRALDTLPDPVLLLDTDFRVQSANRAFCLAFELTPQLTLGRPIGDVAAGAWGAPQLHSLLEQVADRRMDAAKYEMERDFPNIGHKALQLDILRIRPLLCAPPNVLVVMSDITARKQVQRALQHRLKMEELISAIAARFVNLPSDAISDGIDRALRDIGEFAQVDRSYLFLFRDDGPSMDKTNVWCAPGTESHQDELTGICIDDTPWFAEKIRQRDNVHVPRVAELPPAAAAEKRLWHAHGVRSLINVPMVYADKLLGFLGFDSVRAEKTWSAADMRLLGVVSEIFVSALQRQRAEQALRESKERLQQAQRLEAIGKLAGGVAHDFNNVLQGIKLYADLATESLNTGQPIQENLDEINQLASRGRGLTRQLLLFSRRDKPAPVALDISALVRDMSRLLKRLIGEHIAADFRVAPDLGLVRADPGQIEQIVMNLALNARDAMPQGGKLALATANVTLGPEAAGLTPPAPPGPYVMLAATDTGTGMARDTQQHMFEPFFTTKDPSQASGLGLAVVYGIVKQHRGHIRVASEPGHGTTVEVYLPRVQGQTLRPQAHAPAVQPQSGSETILLVEDDEPLREGARRLLAKRGYRLLAAANAAEAQQLFDAHHDQVGLLLSDVVMPGLSGPELYRELAAKCPTLKVLYMSGYNDIITRDSSLIAGDAPLLQKPFDLGDLVRMVREVLDG